jgi:hypothetical protein
MSDDPWAGGPYGISPADWPDDQSTLPEVLARARKRQEAWESYDWLGRAREMGRVAAEQQQAEVLAILMEDE